MVLICDLSNADELMAEYFKGFFDLARPDMSKNVEICMVDILQQLIDECITLPTEVLEMLLANFGTKAIKHNPVTHRITVEICSATKDRLQKYVAQYFNEVIISASREDDQDERNAQLSTAHSLIIQINRAVPSLLLNVIPQLEEELKAEDVQLRVMATRVLGQMFADKTAQGASDLAKTYSSTWRAWLGRANDKSTTLRTVWVESTKALIVNRPELRADLVPLIEQKLLEPEERVRAAMAKTIGSLDYETALHHLDKSVLIKVADRCRDKRPIVRKEALDAVGRLFDMAYSEIEGHDPAATKQFAWIPSEVFRTIYAGGPEMIQTVSATVEQYILPLPSNVDDEAGWTTRLLVVIKFMDPEAIKALLRLTNLIYAHPSIYDHFIACCEAYNGGDVDKDKDVMAVKTAMADSIRRCATQFADPDKVPKDLHDFTKLNDVRIYRSIKACLDPQQDLKSLIKNRSDALRRIENSKASILETMTAFIRNGSYFILNRSSISTLIKRVQQSKSELTASQIAHESQEAAAVALEADSQGQTFARTMATLSDAEAFKAAANELLEFVAKKDPQMFATHVPELARAITEDGNKMLVQTSLQALAAVARWNVDKVQLERKTIERVAKIVQRGTPLQAKYAAKLLAIVGFSGTKGKEGSGRRATQSAAYQVVEEVLESLAKDLGKAKGDRQVASLYALAQMFKHAPDASENVSDTVVKTIVGDILIKPHPKPTGKAAAADEEQDWVEDDKMDTTLKSKLLSLIVLTKRCTAFAETPSASDVAKPIFRLMWAVIAHGEARSLDTPAWGKSRMRLQAALCVLKLARHKVYDQAIGREYFNLAFTVQDECFNVRSRVLHKLLTYLTRRRIDARFLAMGFLAAFDPEEENRAMVSRYCASTARGLPADLRLKLLDVSFPRLLHLLSNHPDFSRESSDELAQFVRYVDFFLDCLCTAQNVSLFFYLATRVKGVRDAESQGASENLYMLSELAQLVIKRRAAQQSWTIESYPGKITLPGDIFKPLPTREVQREASTVPCYTAMCTWIGC